MLPFQKHRLLSSPPLSGQVITSGVFTSEGTTYYGYVTAGFIGPSQVGSITPNIITSTAFTGGSSEILYFVNAFAGGEWFTVVGFSSSFTTGSFDSIVINGVSYPVISGSENEITVSTPSQVLFENQTQTWAIGEA